MKTNHKALFIAVATMLSSPLFAEGIPVEPGLWEMKTVMNMPMMGQPRVTTVTECIETDELNMDEIATDGLDSNCTFEMEQVDGNTMRWSVDCPVEGGNSHGEWEATSNGSTVTGSGVMTMSFSGQSMQMDMSWEGRHIGDCP